LKTRLAIIDLATGDQPLSDNGGGDGDTPKPAGGVRAPLW
jgi:hypothetical protein